MSRRDDDALPDELRPLAERLEADRVRPTPLELDGLYDRARRQVARPAAAPRGRLGRFARLNGVAAFLTAALILTTGTSAVIAATSATNTSFTSVTTPGDAAECEYDDAYSDSYTGTSRKGNSSATISINGTCKGTKICIESTKGISNYVFSTGLKRENFGDPLKICVDIPPGATSITIKAGTTSHTFTFPVGVT